MPKIVDHKKRKEQIAEATWRVIVAQGMEGATVRNIAKEAGFSLGALRHYFSTQDELLQYAVTLVQDRVTERIKQITMQGKPPKEMVLDILLEFVPVDEDRMAEMEVWIAFAVNFKHRQDVFCTEKDAMYLGLQTMIEKLAMHQLLKDGIELEIETERLYAVVDGLALHAMLNSERVSRDIVERILIGQLDMIFKDA